MSSLEQTGDKVIHNVERVIVGKHHEVRLALVALLCRGHLLIEDVPGTGKTVLAKAIARSLGCSFRRIQFTPDLLPSDVSGMSIYNQKTQEFEFRPGPIFSQVVLADEINRATPKTQSSLLECREEPRGSIALYRAGQALAGLLGRDYVIPDDVKALAEPALAHRLIIKTSSSIHDVQAAQVVRELLESTAIEGIRPTGGGPREIRTGA